MCIKLFFTQALGNRAGWGEVLYRATPLIFTGLAVAFAFQCGLFNIGGEGQMVMGGFAITWIGFTFTSLPGFLINPALYSFRSRSRSDLGGGGGGGGQYQAISRPNLGCMKW